jgi:hypothetical protein
VAGVPYPLRSPDSRLTPQQKEQLQGLLLVPVGVVVRFLFRENAGNCRENGVIEEIFERDLLTTR